MEKVTLKAYAKVNIGLDVVGKTDKGYHLLESVMQQVDLYDILTLEVAEEGITLVSSSPDIPCDNTNLAYKAAQLMKEEFSIKEGVLITLDKRIPVAAGMAGGSTDGAAVLSGINRLFDLNCSPEKLKELGLRLGADVPFCIQGGTALAEGIGEILTPLQSAPEMYLLIAKPGLMVSTKYVYENLSLDTVSHPDMKKMRQAFEEKDFQGMISNLGNVLESVTAKEYPIIGELKNAMTKIHAAGTLMSGSGPTVFGIFDTMDKALEGEKCLKEKYPDIFVKAVNIIR